MFSFKKVITKDESTEDENSGTSQGSYNKKVNELRTACGNFGEYLKEVNEKTKFSDIIKKFKDEKNGFGKQMKKSWLLSRTSRRLNEMNKKLSKFQGKTFDPQKVDDYLKCFKFKRETPKNGYIKRSAIDDKEVYDFFNRNVKDDSIFAILDIKQKIYGLNETASTVLDKARNFLTISKETLTGATAVQNEINQTLINIRINREIGERDRIENEGVLNDENGILQQHMTTLNDKNKELQECIYKLQKIITNLGNEQKEKPFGEGWNSLNKLNRAINANNSATNNLQTEINNTRTTLNRVKNNIDDVAQRERRGLNQTAKTVLDKAREFLTTSEETLAEATAAQNEINETLESIEVNQEIGQEYKAKGMDKKALNDKNKELKQCIDALQAAIEDLKNKERETWDIYDKSYSTNEEKRESLNTLDYAIKAINTADESLGNEINYTRFTLLPGVRENIRKAVQEEKERLNKYAETIFSKASNFLTASEKTLTKATSVKGKIEQTLKSINDNKEIGLGDGTGSNTLDEQNRKLQQCIEALQKIIKNLKDKKNQIKKVKDNNSTNEEKRMLLTSLEDLIEANNKAASNLKNEIEGVEKEFDKVEKNIKEIQKESEELNKDVDETFTKSLESMNASRDTLTEATRVKDKIEQTLLDIKEYKGIEREDKNGSIKKLDEQNKELQQCIKALQLAMEDLENKRTRTQIDVHNINYTNEEKRMLLTSLEDLIEANNKAASNLKKEINKIENAKTIAELKKELENLKNKVGNALDEIGCKVKNKGEKILDRAKDGVKNAGNTFDRAGDEIKNVGGRFFSGVKNVGNTFVRAVKNATEAVQKEDGKSKQKERQKSSKKD